VQIYVDGMNLPRIARHLGIHHHTVSLWVQASAASLPEAPVPSEVGTAEMDELAPLSAKKYDLHLDDRRPSNPLLPGPQSDLERTQPAIQELVDDAPKGSSIPVVPLLLMTACGITWADMRFLKAKPIPILWNDTTPSCAITWLVWQDRRDAFRVALMRLNTPCVYLSTATTGDNSTSNDTLPIQPM
jgi:hypothetical protein